MSQREPSSRSVVHTIEAGPPVDSEGDIRWPEFYRARYWRTPTNDLGAPDDVETILPPGRVEVTLQCVDGDMVVTELRLIATPSEPLTAASYRALHFQELVNDLKYVARTHAHESTSGQRLGLAERQKIREAVGQRRINRALLEEVAEIVRQHPLEPTRQVSNQLHTSHRNATRWIAEARRRGILEETGQ